MTYRISFSVRDRRYPDPNALINIEIECEAQNQVEVMLNHAIDALDAVNARQ